MSSLLVICLGWCSNFVGSESGQKQRVKILQKMVYYSTIEEGKGATVHKYCCFVHGGNSSQAGSKIQTTELMYLQSIKSVKHNAAKSVNRSILKKSRHIGFGAFIVHSFMLLTLVALFRELQTTVSRKKL